MRFIGNKENLLNNIYSELSIRNIKGNSFFDFFAGTGNVGKFFKEKGYQVFSSDVLYFSYVLQRAYIQNNNVVTFNKLIKKFNIKNTNDFFSTPLDSIVDFLNQIEPKKGFIYKNYAPSGTVNLEQPRMYFNDGNAQKIDAIRETINIWKYEELISDNEYYILIACLIETVPFYANISGVYAAFNKKWDPRAKKELVLRSIKLILNDKTNESFNCNSIELLKKIKTDIIYLDPPYNHRQYAPNYHLLETIAKYDSPTIKGITGMRNYDDQKSNFCNKLKALKELEKIASEAQYKYLILSYNSEGIMQQGNILDILQKFGIVELIEFSYRRYKSNNNGLSKTKKNVQEQLYILERKS